MNSDHVAERRQFISDAFHTLNQPLTGLHCGLEIALQKPRSEGEYRQRIGDGVEHATAILTLIRAVRQLVDAADPGERFGTVSLAAILAQAKNELEVLVEAAGVELEIVCERDAPVKADPGKLVVALAGLIASEMESLKRGGKVEVRVKRTKKRVELLIDGTGSRKSVDGAGKSGKIEEIRRNAAVSYLWAIGCHLDWQPLRITMPSLKSEPVVS